MLCQLKKYKIKDSKSNVINFYIAKGCNINVIVFIKIISQIYQL